MKRTDALSKKIDNRLSMDVTNAHTVTTVALYGEMAKIIRWLKLGASDDPSRPALQCIRCKGRELATTNGFVAHRVTILESASFDFPEGTWRIVALHAKYLLLEKEEELKFPNYEAMWPQEEKKSFTFPGEIDKTYQIRMYFNPRLLTNAFSIGRNFSTAQIVVAGGPAVLHVVTKYEDRGFIADALVMPMYCDYDKANSYAIPGGGLIFTQISADASVSVETLTETAVMQ